MTDNRTTELLREGLIEHGIEWQSGLKGVTLVGDWCFVEYDNGKLAATCEPVLTPEQAVAATLGSEDTNRAFDLIESLRCTLETCRRDEKAGFDAYWITADCMDKYIEQLEKAIATLGSNQELIELAHNAWVMALCAMHGMPIPADWGNSVERGLRKYGIDVDDEKGGFEVSDDEW